MRSMFTAAATTLIMLSCIAPTGRSPYSDLSLMPHIFRVEGNDGGVGSAVPIAQRGEFLWLLTVRHIPLPQRADGLAIMEVERHPRLDLALLKVRASAPLVPLASRGPRAAERLRAVGWSLADFLAMTDGRARPGRAGKGHGMTCPVLFGASGGAVLNDAGELVGIIAALQVWEFRVRDGEGSTHLPIPWLSYYVPILEAKEWIASVTQKGES